MRVGEEVEVEERGEKKRDLKGTKLRDQEWPLSPLFPIASRWGRSRGYREVI